MWRRRSCTRRWSSRPPATSPRSTAATSPRRCGSDRSPRLRRSRLLGDRAHRRLRIDHVAARILGDREGHEILDLRIDPVAREDAVEPRALIERLGVGEALPLIDAARRAVLAPDELL